MNVTEFSTEFDVLYNSITSNNAPGLDDYEKSVFLTKAQYDLLREYFNPRTDNTNGGFDSTPKRQYDFSNLTKVSNLETATSDTLTAGYNNSKVFKYPTDYFLTLNESLSEQKDNRIYYYNIIPINYQEFNRLFQKPYKYPSINSAWRLFIGNDSNIPVVQVIADFRNTDSTVIYNIRYIRKPKPIILTDLSMELQTIDGEDAVSTSIDMPEQTHREILERAVTLAKIAYIGGSTPTLAQTQNTNSNDNR